LINRGPIEAGDFLGWLRSSRVFPRLINRGPIEALKGLLSGIVAAIFPRLINRGPIEAFSVKSPICLSPDFRG